MAVTSRQHPKRDGNDNIVVENIQSSFARQQHVGKTKNYLTIQPPGIDPIEKGAKGGEGRGRGGVSEVVGIKRRRRSNLFAGLVVNGQKMRRDWFYLPKKPIARTVHNTYRTAPNISLVFQVFMEDEIELCIEVVSLDE